jgi:hypothetical protein
VLSILKHIIEEIKQSNIDIKLHWNPLKYKASRYKGEAYIGPYKKLLPLLSPSMQMFLFTKWRVVVRLFHKKVL